MFSFLSKEVQDGLEQARKKAWRQGHRLSVHVGDDVFPIRRLWDTGMALSRAQAAHIRGLVDIYDGPRHVFQCLIYAGEDGDDLGDEVVFEFKRKTVASDTAPVDFEIEGFVPAAYLQSLPTRSRV